MFMKMPEEREELSVPFQPGRLLGLVPVAGQGFTVLL